jgi:RNA polymerase sigma factor (TIGR02999 family)
VNEAWIKLAHSPRFVAESKLHFKRIAGRAMRQLLIEAARRKHASKRGADFLLVTFDEAVESAPARANELLALDAALEQLADLNPRQAMVVECRFFAGLEISEIADELNISEATVLRDWRAAKAWLAAMLRQSHRSRF